MKIAVWQTHPRHDVDQALSDLDAAVRDADAELFVTPEMYMGGYNVGADRVTELAAMAVDVGAIAKASGTTIVCGMATSGDTPYNSAVVFGPDGQEVTRYHKAHLFGDLDRRQFAAGPAMPPVFKLGDWTVGLAICYDIEFPETARHLAALGAELIVVPTANMIPFDSVPLRLVPARAEENEIVVAYANYIGVEGPLTYGGLSCICGPDGDDIARAARDETILIAQLDRAALNDRRAQIHHTADRRTDLY